MSAYCDTNPSHVGTSPAPRLTSAPLRSVGSYLGNWSRSEFMLLLREPVAVFFSLVFPLIILAFIGTAYGNEEVEEGVAFIDVMYPALLGTVVANITLMGMPTYFADLRARKVLKRYRALPMPRWVPGFAIEAALFGLVMISVAIITVAVSIFYGIQSTALSVAFVGIFLGLVIWLSMFGLLLGSLPAKARTIQSVSAALFFFMFFGSGYAAPIDGLPGWLAAITNANPLRWWLDALVDIYTGLSLSTQDVTRLLLTLVIAALTLPISLRLLGSEQDG